MPTRSFLIGLAALGAAHKPGISEERREALLDEAIAVLRRMLVDRPDLVRVRLELGRAFFLKEEDTLARRHFEQVLAGKPPAAVAINVGRFLSIMRARKRWSIRVGAALAPDSNISSQTRERTIVLDTPIGRLPFNYRSDDEPETGTGISIWAGGEYQYPLSPRWRLRSGADFSRRDYRWRDLGVRVEAAGTGSPGGPRPPDHLNASRHERRYEGRDWLDGPLTDISAGIAWIATPHNAGRRRARLEPAEDRAGERAQFQPLGPRGRGAGASLGLHRGRGGHAALDRIRGRLDAVRPRRRGAPRPSPGRSASTSTTAASR